MKTLKIDEKWSVEYDETQNDQPVRLLRYGDEMGRGNWTGEVYAMFYALLAHEEAAADTRRLTRELDVAMHGEAGAAEQASLCDLIPAVKALRTKTIDAMMEAANPLLTVDTSNHVTRDVLALGAPITIPDAAIACGYPSLTEALENDATRAVVFAVMAQMRYEYADTMLKAREGV